MSTPTTARPPRPNNLPNVRLSDPAVEAFLNKATGEGEGPRSAAPTPEPVSPPAPQAPLVDVTPPERSFVPAPPPNMSPLAFASPVPAPPPPLASGPAYVPPAVATKEAMRAWTMRLPPDVHASLKWIAENGGPSMNEFILQALRDAIPPAVEKLTKAQAMGLFLKRGR